MSGSPLVTVGFEFRALFSPQHLSTSAGDVGKIESDNLLRQGSLSLQGALNRLRVLKVSALNVITKEAAPLNSKLEVIYSQNDVIRIWRSATGEEVSVRAEPGRARVQVPDAARHRAEVQGSQGRCSLKGNHIRTLI